MKIIVLNSGSNGNAVYVESDSGTAILLDCGISRKQIEQRLKVHGRFPQSVLAVFITHEHGDHVNGLPAFNKYYPCPVYFTEWTYRYFWRRQLIKGFRFIGNTETVEIGEMVVRAIPKTHDARDPVSFLVRADGKEFLYATDMGVLNEHHRAILPTVDALMLESNYDSEMLWNGEYPLDLKKRIDSDRGHLSNAQVHALLQEHCDGRLHTLILGHLSENNNTPELVSSNIERLYAGHEKQPVVHIASRYSVSDVIVV